MTSTTVEPGAAIWGAAILILVGLLLAAFLFSRLLRDRSLGVRLVAGVVLLVALAASGWGVSALANAWLPLDMRVAPGILAQWSPAFLAAVCAALLTLRQRRHAAS